MRTTILVACVTLLCACAGPLLEEPFVSNSDLTQARNALVTHQLNPSLVLRRDDMRNVLTRAWGRTEPAVRRVCGRVFSNCGQAIGPMNVVLVADPSVNAYADAQTWQIGVHEGFMRAMGSEEELIAVLGHEAAHLLLGHTNSKVANSNMGMLMGMLAGVAAGTALYQPGMDQQVISDLTTGGMEIGAEIGMLVYSPDMEIEADQFATYVLADLGIRLDAGLDMLVRLSRGDVPAPVRRGEGWAGYIMTHPPHDYRLAAMQATMKRIRSGGRLQLAE